MWTVFWKKVTDLKSTVSSFEFWNLKSRRSLKWLIIFSVDEKYPVRNHLERKKSAVEGDIKLSIKLSKRREIVNFFGAVESNVKRSK